MEKNTNFNYKKLSPFKWFVLENFPFLEADFDALTEWQLFCKLRKEINKIIESQNIVGKQELTNAFNNLQNYVNDYFENLDVQTEINNKLNEMAESGELQQIIGEFLKLNSLITFDTVEDMKASANLINGSYAKTLGFNTKNDSGSSLYKIRTITNTDIVDNMSIIALNQNDLIAEFIKSDIICPEQFGAKGDGVTDDSNILSKTFDFASKNGLQINLVNKYFINNEITFDNGQSLIINGSHSQIGSTVSENIKTFANLIFGENGYIETNGTSNITFQNVGMNGVKNGIIFKSFRNRILNSGFNGFENAIQIQAGKNWNGENLIQNCCFNTVTNCIKLLDGSDGDINGNLIDGTCTTFITGENDGGYKIENNHDYSKQGSIIHGSNLTFVGNYVDGWNKLTITGNSGFNISSNTFIGINPDSGVNYAIKFTAETIANGLVSSNILNTSRNDLKNDFLFFLNLEDVSYFNANLSANNTRVCKKIFYSPSGAKLGETNLNDIYLLNCTSINDKAELVHNVSRTVLSGPLIIAYNKFNLHSPTSIDIANLDNMAINWIHFIKMGNNSQIYTRIGDGRTIKAQGDYFTETTLECWSLGIRDNLVNPSIF